MPKKGQGWLSRGVEPLSPAVRVQLARALTLAMTPVVVMGGALIAGGVAWASGLDRPQRYAPFGLILATGLAVALLARRGRWVAALGALTVGLAAATGAGTVVNSIHAPAFAANLLLLMVVTPVFGRVGGYGVLAWTALTGVAWLELDRRGLAVVPEHLQGFVLYASVCCMVAVGVVLASIPAHLLGRALVAANQRLTDLRDAQRAERRAEDERRGVLDQLHASVVVLDPTGAVLHVNRLGAVWLRESEDELRRKSDLSAAELWQPEERCALASAISTAREGKERRFEITRVENDIERVYDVQVSPSLGVDGDVLRIVVEVADVTALVRARVGLEQARRMELVGQLSGVVAHDFNNMLSAILASTELLDHTAASDEVQLREHVETIRQAAGRAAGLTRKLLAMGRADQFDRNVFDLNRMLLDMASLLRTTLGARVQLRLQLDHDAVCVDGDAATLEQAVLNLCINARDAITGRGTVTITTGRLTYHLDGRPEAERRGPDGQYAVLAVSDDGPGIERAVRRQLFEPFFTTKPRGKGTGLGLSAVHGTVNGHGGYIDLDSELGVGTTFRLHLPLAGSSADSCRVVAQSGVVKKPSPRVLLVDDEELTRRSVGKLLVSMGARVEAVESAEQALGHLRSGNGIDLVVTDLAMPGMGGPELVKILGEEFEAVPVILMTGFVSRELARDLPEDRRYPLLRKPFQAEQLSALVARQLSAAASTPPADQAATQAGKASGEGGAGE